MTLVAFLIALGLLVTAHEWGHYRVAVACGVRVLRFSIGFGRPLLRWTRPDRCGQGETEFVIGLIPLGGYVRMLDGREDSLPPEQAHLAFDRQPLGARSAIVAAGPLANLLLAVLLYAATFWLGQWETRPVLSAPLAGSPAQQAGLRSGDVVSRVAVGDDVWREVLSLEDLRWWLMLQEPGEAVRLEVSDGEGMHRRVLALPASSRTDRNGLLSLASWGLDAPRSWPVIGRVMPDGAAQRAGFEAGDRVLRIDGQIVEDAAQLRAWVRRQTNAETLPWQVQRREAVLTLQVRPDVVDDGGQRVGRIGAFIGEPPARVWVALDAWTGAVKAVERTFDVMRLSVRMLVAMVSAQASWDNLSGPLSMAEFAGQSVRAGFGAYLAYLALLSVSLAVFNLLPLPVLDGGHLMYYLYEFLMGRPPAARWLVAMQQVGVALLLALTAFALFNDLSRLGWWP